MEIIIKIFVVFMLFLIGRGLYLGVTNKAVFYMDKEDMIISLSVWIVPILGAIINMLGWDWLMYVLALITIAVVLLVIFSAYHYNQDNLSVAIPISISKIALSGMVIIYAFKSYSDIGNDEISGREYGFTLLVLGALSALKAKLVNGEEVYELNGWELRESVLDRLNEDTEEDVSQSVARSEKKEDEEGYSRSEKPKSTMGDLIDRELVNKRLDKY